MGPLSLVSVPESQSESEFAQYFKSSQVTENVFYMVALHFVPITTVPTPGVA